MIKAATKQLVLKRKQEGASLIEYAVIAALVVALAVAAFAVIGGDDGPLVGAFQGIANALTGATQ